MNNIKNFHIPTYLLETAQLEKELHGLEKITGHLENKVKKLKAQSQVIDCINKSIQHFQSIVPKAYPQVTQLPVVKSMLEELPVADFESYEDFKNLLAEILYRIYFSEGEDKVFDKSDADVFNETKCLALIQQGIRIPDQWLEQFVRCLTLNNAEEDMLLHTMTPEWLWPRCFRLLLELYNLTKETITKKN